MQKQSGANSKLRKAKRAPVSDIAVGGDQLFVLHTEKDILDVWETPACHSKKPDGSFPGALASGYSLRGFVYSYLFPEATVQAFEVALPLV